MGNIHNFLSEFFKNNLTIGLTLNVEKLDIFFYNEEQGMDITSDHSY